MNIEKALKEFHSTYHLPIGESPEDFQNLDRADRMLRIRLLKEEMREYMAAESDNNLIEVADALADIVYIAVGTAVAYGIPFNEVFREVHGSNMSKLDDNGQPIYRQDGKVMKGDNYYEPNIAGILFR